MIRLFSLAYHTLDTPTSALYKALIRGFQLPACHYSPSRDSYSCHTRATMAPNQETGMAADAITPAVPLDLEMTSMQLTTTVKRDEDPFLVAFKPNYDEENPLDWPKGRKWAVTDTLSATGFNRIMVSTIM